MSIITHGKILEEIEKGNIKIEPFSKNQIGPASVDLHLSNTFRVFKRQEKIIRITSNEVDLKKITVLIEIKKDGYLLIRPGETVLGITREKITLSPNICGWLEGRSRYSRIGLAVHITASFIQPGIDNHQVLEITNVGPNAMALYPGIPICQMAFERCEGKAKYKGRYKDQKTP